MLAVSLLAGAAVMGGAMPWRRRLVRWLSGLVEWEGRRGRRLVIGDPRAISSLTGAIAVGAVAFWGSVVAGAVGGRVSSAGVSYQAPSQPSAAEIVVIDTSTIRVIGGAFDGFSDDVLDSMQTQLDRYGANFSSPLTNAVNPAFTEDTLSDNTDLKADTTYSVRYRYFGELSLQWSAWSDTTAFVNEDGGTPFFTDGFESCDLSHAEGGGEWDGTNTGADAEDDFDVTTTNPRAGSCSAEFTFGGSSSGGDAWSELRFSWSSTLTEMWVEYYVYFPDGTEGFGSAAYDHRSQPQENNKLLRVWGGNYTTTRAKWGASFIGDGAGANISTLNCEYDAGGGMGEISCPRYNSGVTDSDLGNWVQFRFHGKAGTSSNAVFQIWKDGSLVVDIDDADQADGSAWDSGYLLGWSNSGYAATTKLWIDDVKLYSSDPGW